MADRPIAEGVIRFTPDTRSLARVEKAVKKTMSRIEALASRGGLLSKAYTQPLGKITGAADEFTKSLEASNARVIAFGASAGIIYNVQRALTGAANAAIQLEKKLADINVILNASTSGLKKFSEELFNIAKGTGQTFDSVSEAALEFARQGLAVEETLKRTRDAMVLVRLSGLDVKSSVESITATLNSFNQTVITSTQLVNKLANVDAAFAVSSADLADAIRRVGSSAQDANVGIDQLIAMVTTAQQVTARGGSVIGNSLKTIFTRLQRPAVLKDLEAFGVRVKDAQGAMLPAVQVLKNFAGAYGTLAPAQKAVAAEMVGGVFQVNVLKAAVGDLGKQFSIYDRALSTSVGSTNQAIERNALLNKTLATLINESLVNVQKVGAAFAKMTITPALTSVLEGVNSAIEKLEDKAKDNGLGVSFGKGILDGISNILKGPALIAIAGLLGKLTYSFFKFSTDAVKTFAGLNNTAAKQKEMQSLIQNILLKNPSLIQSAASSAEGLRMVETEILKVVQARNVALQEAATLSGRIAANLTAADVKSMASSVGGGAARGFVPNYNKRTENRERAGAWMGGYEPGQIKTMNIDGVGKVTYNSAETVKKFDGMRQPAIMPPKDSEAGKEYKKRFQDAHGFSPYSMGLVPNFAAQAKLKQNFGVDSILDGDTIVGDIRRNQSFRLKDVDAPESNQKYGSEATKFLKGYSKEKIAGWMTTEKGAYDRLMFTNKAYQKSLVKKGLGVPDLRYAQLSDYKNDLSIARGSKAHGGSRRPRGMWLDRSHPKIMQFLAQEKLKDADMQDLYAATKGGRKKYAALGGLYGEDLGRMYIGDRARNVERNLTSKQIEARTKGKMLIRGPEGETLVLGSDLAGAAQSITVGGLSSRKIKKANPQYRTLLDQVPNLFDGLSYQVMSAVGAKFNKEGTSGALAGVKFEQEFAAKHGLPEAGAKKGSDFVLGEKLAKQLGTQKNLQLKLSMFERSKRDVNKVVDVASSFSKYLVDILTNNIKSQGLSKLVGQDRFGSAMRVLNQNPAIKKQWSKYFGQMGTRNQGLVPNLAQSALATAVSREKAAGYSSGQVRVGYDSRLTASGGLGVFNTTEGSLGRAINMHLASGKTMRQVRRQGASSGVVPNFVDGMGMGMGAAGMGLAAMSLQSLVSGIKDTEEAFREMDKSIKEDAETQKKAIAEQSESVGSASKVVEEAANMYAQAQKGVVEAAQKNISITESISQAEEKKSAIQQKINQGMKDASMRGAKGDFSQSLVKGRMRGDDPASKAFREKVFGKGRKKGKLSPEDRAKVEAALEAEEKELQDKKVSKLRGSLKVQDDILKERKAELETHKAGAKTRNEEKKIAKDLLETSKQQLNAEKDKLDKVKADNQDQKKTQAQLDRFSGHAQALMFNAPMIAGIAGQMANQAGMGQMGQSVINAAGTGIGTGAAAGFGVLKAGDQLNEFAGKHAGKAGMMGKLGGLAGGAAAVAGPLAAAAAAGLAIDAAVKAFRKAQVRKEADKVAASLEAVGEKLNKVQQSGQVFMESLDKLDAMLENPAGANPEDIKRVEDQMAKALADAPDEFRQKMVDAAGNADKIKAAFGEIIEDLSEQKAGFAAAKDVYDMREKFATSGIFTGDDTLFDRKRGGALSAEGRRVEDTIKMGISGSARREKMREAIEGGRQLDFTDAATRMEFFASAFANSVDTMTDPRDIQHTAGLMQEFFNDIVDGGKKSKKINADLKRRKELEAAYQKQMNELNKDMKGLVASLAQVTKNTEASLFATQKFNNGIRDFQLDMATASYEGARKVNAPFMTKLQQGRSDAEARQFQIRSKSIKEMRTAIAEGVRNSLTISSEQFMKAAEKVEKASADIAAKENRELLTEFQRNSKALDALKPVMEEGFKDFAENPDKLDALADISTKMEKALVDAGYDQKKAAATSQVLVEAMRGNKDATVDKLAGIIQNQKFQLALEQEQAYWAQESAKLQTRLAVAGGAGDFMKSGQTSLSGNFSKMSDALNTAITASVSRSIIDLGRANTQILDILLNNLNFDSLRAGLDQLVPLLGPAIAGRARDLEAQAAFAAELSQIQGMDVDLSGFDAQSIAIEQLSAQLKLSELPDHVSKIRENTALLNTLIAAQATDMASKNRDAFSDALRMNGLHNVASNQMTGIVAGQNTVASTEAIQKINMRGFNMLPESFNKSMQPFRDRMQEIGEVVQGLQVLRQAKDQNFNEDLRTAEAKAKANREAMAAEGRQAAIARELTKGIPTSQRFAAGGGAAHYGKPIGPAGRAQAYAGLTSGAIDARSGKFDQRGGEFGIGVATTGLEAVAMLMAAEQKSSAALTDAEKRYHNAVLERTKKQIKDIGLSDKAVALGREKINAAWKKSKLSNQFSLNHLGRLGLSGPGNTPADKDGFGTRMDAMALAHSGLGATQGAVSARQRDQVQLDARVQAVGEERDAFFRGLGMVPTANGGVRPAQTARERATGRSDGPGGGALSDAEQERLTTELERERKAKNDAKEAAKKAEAEARKLNLKKPEGVFNGLGTKLAGTGSKGSAATTVPPSARGDVGAAVTALRGEEVSVLQAKLKSLNEGIEFEKMSVEEINKVAGINAEEKAEFVKRSNSETERLTLVKDGVLRLIDIRKGEETRAALEEKLREEAKKKVAIMSAALGDSEQQTKLLDLYRRLMMKMADKKTFTSIEELLKLSQTGGDPAAIRSQIDAKAKEGLMAQVGVSGANTRAAQARANFIAGFADKRNRAGKAAFESFKFGDLREDDFNKRIEEGASPLEAAEQMRNAGIITKKQLDQVRKAMEDASPSILEVQKAFNEWEIETSVDKLKEGLDKAKAGLSNSAEIQSTIKGTLDTFVNKGGDLHKIEEELNQMNLEKGKASMEEITRVSDSMAQGLVNAQDGLSLLNQKIQDVFLNPAMTADNVNLNQLKEDVTVGLAGAQSDYTRQFNLAKAAVKEGIPVMDQLRESLRGMNETAMKTGTYGAKNFINSIRDEFTYTQENFYQDLDAMGRDFARDFKSGIASTFSQAIKGTKDLEDAWQEMIKGMADKMLDKSLEMAVNSIFGAIGFKEGGLVPRRYSRGGMITGGSGVKDDVPAYLTSGEYVIRKRTVDQYGKDFFDGLNSAKVVAAAKGGKIREFGQLGNEKILSHRQAIGIFSNKRANLAAINAERTARQRSFDAAGIEPYGYKVSTDEDKEDWLGRPTGEKVMANRVGFRLNFARPLTPERIASIQETAAKYPEIAPYIDPDIFQKSTVQIGQGASKFKFKNSFIYNETKRPTAGKYFVDPRLSSLALTDENDPQNKYKFEKADSFFNYQKERLDYYSDKQEEMKKYEEEKKSRRKSFLFGAGAFALAFGAKGFSKGGRSKDDIPALLTGGEYVITKDIVDKYGLNFFENLNRGRIAAYNKGGYVPPVIGARRAMSEAEQDTRPSKEKPSNTNNVNISINFDAARNISSESKEGGSTSTNPQSREETRQLADRVRGAVLGVLADEKRPGGMLYRTPGSV